MTPPARPSSASRNWSTAKCSWPTETAKSWPWTRLRQFHRFQVVFAGLGSDQDQRVVLVEAVELLDAFERRDRFILLAGLVADVRGDRVHLVDALGRDFHHAARAVGHQNVFLPVLLINDHVQRAVAVAELRNGRPLDLFARLQLAAG